MNNKIQKFLSTLTQEEIGQVLCEILSYGKYDYRGVWWDENFVIRSVYEKSLKYNFADVSIEDVAKGYLEDESCIFSILDDTHEFDFACSMIGSTIQNDIENYLNKHYQKLSEETE